MLAVMSINVFFVVYMK